jgi:chorismate mutase
MPPTKSPPDHGTRSCYVRWKCRCEPCKAANRSYYHARQKLLAKALSKGIEHRINKPQADKVLVDCVTPKGTHYVRAFKSPCPGIDGRPCRLESYLKKNSKGGICGDCREQLVKKEWVDAEPSRLHLLELSAKGIGLRAVQVRAKVAYSALQDIKSRGQLRVDPRTARRILAVKARKTLDGHLVRAKETRALIAKMRVEFQLPDSEIAARLGYASLAIQLKKKNITLKNKRRVEALYRELTKEKAEYVVPVELAERFLEKALKRSGAHRRQLAAKLGWKDTKFRVVDGKVTQLVFDELQAVLEKLKTVPRRDKGVHKAVVDKQLAALREETWYSQEQLMAKLGWPGEEVPLASPNRATTEFAEAVKKLYKQECRVGASARVSEPCANCGLSHAREDRLKLITRMLPCRSIDVVQAYPCIYPTKVYTNHNGLENRMVHRDIQDLKAVLVKGTFYLPEPARENTPAPAG